MLRETQMCGASWSSVEEHQQSAAVIIQASADGRGRTHDKNKCRRTEGAMSFHDFEGET